MPGIMSEGSACRFWPQVWSTLRKPISAPRMLGIGGDFQQRLRRWPRTAAVNSTLLFCQHQRHQLMGHAEDHVIVGRRQQFPLARRQPLLAGVGLALRAVAIAAGVVRDGPMAAAVALIAMPAERGRAAALDGPAALSPAARSTSPGSDRRIDGRICG